MNDAKYFMYLNIIILKICRSAGKKVKKKRGNQMQQPFNQINRVSDAKKRNQQDLLRPAFVSTFFLYN